MPLLESPLRTRQAEGNRAPRSRRAGGRRSWSIRENGRQVRSRSRTSLPWRVRRSGRAARHHASSVHAQRDDPARASLGRRRPVADRSRRCARGCLGRRGKPFGPARGPVTVACLGFVRVRRRSRPWCGDRFARVGLDGPVSAGRSGLCRGIVARADRRSGDRAHGMGGEDLAADHVRKAGCRQLVSDPPCGAGERSSEDLSGDRPYVVDWRGVVRLTGGHRGDCAAA